MSAMNHKEGLNWVYGRDKAVWPQFDLMASIRPSEQRSAAIGTEECRSGRKRERERTKWVTNGIIMILRFELDDAQSSFVLIFSTERSERLSMLAAILPGSQDRTDHSLRASAGNLQASNKHDCSKCITINVIKLTEFDLLPPIITNATESIGFKLISSLH